VAAVWNHAVMGDVDPTPTRSTAGRVIPRIAVGVVVLVVVAGSLVFWNPWHLVVVERILFIPAVAVTVTIVFGLAVAALPGHSSTDRRVLAAVSVPVLSLQMWAMAPGWPSDGPREMARSPDGERVVMLHRTALGGQCLSVWAGHGPGARVAGSFGDPGDEPVVTFERRDLVVAWVLDDSSWSAPRRETFELRLDPVTGRPLDALRTPC
jgi:hypothetical protein